MYSGVPGNQNIYNVSRAGACGAECMRNPAGNSHGVRIRIRWPLVVRGTTLLRQELILTDLFSLILYCACKLAAICLMHLKHS